MVFLASFYEMDRFISSYTEYGVENNIGRYFTAIFMYLNKIIEK